MKEFSVSKETDLVICWYVCIEIRDGIDTVIIGAGRMRNFLSILGIFVLAPVLVTLAVNGYEALSARKDLSREEYLPQLLYRDIPAAYEEEALKAQAVLERSSLFFYSGAQWREILADCVKISRTKEYQAVEEALSRAAAETEGVFLTKNGQTVRGISHRVSAGHTRNGAEVTELPGYGELVSVESGNDTVEQFGAFLLNNELVNAAPP